MKKLLLILLITGSVCGCREDFSPTQQDAQEASWERFSTMKDWLAYLESEYGVYASKLPQCIDCYDPQADDPEKFHVIMGVYDAVAEDMEIDAASEQSEFCKQFWAKMKVRLREKGIDWKTPPEMNPGMNIE